MQDHPLRYSLTNELHARPFAELRPPERASHLAMLSPEDNQEAERAHLVALCKRFGVPEVPPEAKHFNAEFGAFRLKWERHSEFSSYTFFQRGRVNTLFAEPVIEQVPAEWLEALPGERLVAIHIDLQDWESPGALFEDLSHVFVSESLCRTLVLNGAAEVWKDFRIHADGFSRTLIRDHGLLPRQAGRLVQRLLEMETYRNMALLALPLAHKTSPSVTRIDHALADLTARMRSLTSSDDERDLLDRLMALSAEIEESIATTAFRFSAAQAYGAIVAERISEIREKRIEGYPTLGEFIDRRLAPALRTCESVAARQQGLSERATRSANLLRTRVDIALEGQNRDLLASMNRRAKLQFRLQQTVEGLSIAAITYYVVSLLGYALKAIEGADVVINVELLRGLSIPVVVFLVWLGVRMVRKALHGADD